jgi:hypothetical protein
MPEVRDLLLRRGVPAERAEAIAALSRGRPGWALAAATDDEVVQRHERWARRLDEVVGAPADVALGLAAELDSANFQWRGSDRAAEDPVLFALGSWQLHLRRRMLDEPAPAMGRWARLLERSYDTLGYLEQNVSPRLALECFLLECRTALDNPRR